MQVTRVWSLAKSRAGERGQYRPQDNHHCRTASYARFADCSALTASIRGDGWPVADNFWGDPCDAGYPRPCQYANVRARGTRSWTPDFRGLF